jgi:ribosomal protein S12 methylthiotransferase accessory factor
VSDSGRLRIRERCRVVVPRSIPDPELGELVGRIERNATKVVLMWVESRVAVHTFWTVLVNRRPSASVSARNIGAGCHSDPGVAAARALTEAAQARLTFIQGAREDRLAKPVDRAEAVPESPAYRYFAELEPDTAWDALPGAAAPPPPGDLAATLARLVAALGEAGQPVVRFDLTRPEIGVPVVKLLAPGLAFNRRLF